MREKNG
jgi:hypothetical protein